MVSTSIPFFKVQPGFALSALASEQATQQQAACCVLLEDWTQLLYSVHQDSNLFLSVVVCNRRPDHAIRQLSMLEVEPCGRRVGGADIDALLPQLLDRLGWIYLHLQKALMRPTSLHE